MRYVPGISTWLLALFFTNMPNSDGAPRAERTTAPRDAFQETDVMNETPALASPQHIPGDYLWLLRYEDRGQELDANLQTLLDQLKHSKISTAKEAEGVAIATKLKNAGFLDQECARAIGLVKSAVDLPGFVSRGDLIWIVRILVLGSGVSQEAWIGSKTGNVRWIFPIEGGVKDLPKSQPPIPSKFEWSPPFLIFENGQWHLIIKKNGSGFGGNGAPPGVLFPPKTFDVKAIDRELRPNLSLEAPKAAGRVYGVTWFTGHEPNGMFYYTKGPEPIAYVFELFRKACHNLKYDMSNSIVANAWRKDPPTPVSKPWDAKE
jgi:hypothetical protein